MAGSRSTFGWLFAALASLAVAPGCTRRAAEAAAADCQLVSEGSGPAGEVAVRAETVVSGLEVPWGIAFLPGGDWLVTERPGRIRLVTGGQLVPDPVAVVPAQARAEGGLLGIAAHPDFASNRLFFVYFTGTASSGEANRIERWKLSEDHRSAARDAVVLEGIPAARFHDGGRLRFGPDGLLYVGTGDATEPDRAQDPESLAGKILRVAADGAVPPDNPRPGSPVFALGVRNVEAFDWDEAGRLYVADHGPSGELGRSGHDEVSLAAKGANLGWPTIFGCQTGPGLVAPSLSWVDAVPPGGAAFYTGQAIPDWRGSLIIGTLGSRHLHRVRFERGAPQRVSLHEVYLAGEPPQGLGRVREVAMGPDGQLYATTSNCDGRGTCPPERDRIVRIVRIVPR